MPALILLTPHHSAEYFASKISVFLEKTGLIAYLKVSTSLVLSIQWVVPCQWLRLCVPHFHMFYTNSLSQEHPLCR